MNKAKMKILKENKLKMKIIKFMNPSLKTNKIFHRVRVHKKIMKYIRKKAQRKRMTLRKRKS